MAYDVLISFGFGFVLGALFSRIGWGYDYFGRFIDCLIERIRG